MSTGSFLLHIVFSDFRWLRYLNLGKFGNGLILGVVIILARKVEAVHGGVIWELLGWAMAG